MRVFVTGATGFIGSAVVRELRSAGHEVLGLARNDERAADLTSAGVVAHRGDLSDVESLAAGARASDGAIHVAFDHGFGTTPRNVAAELDRRAIEAMAAVLEGKALVVTSGTALLPPGSVGTELGAPVPTMPRSNSEVATLAAADRGVRSSVIRLSPTVHGVGDHGFVPIMIDIARRTGVAAYIGDGMNRWPAVHRLDGARLFRLALEHGAPGSRFHAVAEEGIAMREIAETIGAALNMPVKSIAVAEAQAHFEWLAPFVGIDNPTSSAITRETLDWHPTGPGLLSDMRDNGYFVAPRD